LIPSFIYVIYFVLGRAERESTELIQPQLIPLSIVAKDSVIIAPRKSQRGAVFVVVDLTCRLKQPRSRAQPRVAMIEGCGRVRGYDAIEPCL
jgi:hypothetical protein